MRWFKEKKKKEAMIQAIRPTSKATLKVQCLFACRGDIDESAKLYDYFAKDMPDLPDYDPAQPTWVDNTRDMANGIMGWLRDNSDTIAQGYDFIRGIVQSRTLPPVAAETAAEALPPIN